MKPTAKQARYEREKRIYNAHPDKMHVSEAAQLVKKIDEKRVRK